MLDQYGIIPLQEQATWVHPKWEGEPGELSQQYGRKFLSPVRSTTALLPPTVALEPAPLLAPSLFPKIASSQSPILNPSLSGIEEQRFRAEQ